MFRYYIRIPFVEHDDRLIMAARDVTTLRFRHPESALANIGRLQGFGSSRNIYIQLEELENFCLARVMICRNFCGFLSNVSKTALFLELPKTANVYTRFSS